MCHLKFYRRTCPSRIKTWKIQHRVLNSPRSLKNKMLSSQSTKPRRIKMQISMTNQISILTRASRISIWCRNSNSIKMSSRSWMALKIPGTNSRWQKNNLLNWISRSALIGLTDFKILKMSTRRRKFFKMKKNKFHPWRHRLRKSFRW